MNSIVRQVSLIVLCMIPVAVVVFVLSRRRRQWRSKSRVPFRELRRRPAGESLRLKLELLDEKINDGILFLVGFPVVLGMVGGFIHLPHFAFPTSLFLISLVWT